MDLIFAEEKRKFYVNELLSLREKAHSFGISKNRALYQRGTIDSSVWIKYKNNSKRILEVEKEIIKLNEVIKQHRREKKDDNEVLKNILNDSLPENDYKAVIIEFERRLKGEGPIKIAFSNADKSKEFQRIKRLKESLLNAIEVLITARSGIDNYIFQNEPETNKADYLLSVKELNKSCPPLSEIEKLKKIIYQ